MKLYYYDHLLQKNMTGMATCEDPVMSSYAAPLLICRTTNVIVKLPLGTRLRKVEKLGEDIVVQNFTIMLCSQRVEKASIG